MSVPSLALSEVLTQEGTHRTIHCNRKLLFVGCAALLSLGLGCAELWRQHGDGPYQAINDPATSMVSQSMAGSARQPVLPRMSWQPIQTMRAQSFVQPAGFQHLPTRFLAPRSGAVQTR